MEKKLHFVGSRFDTQRGIELSDGRVMSLYNEDNEFYLRFDNPLNLSKGTFEPRVAVENELTLNTIIRGGLGKEVHCYNELQYMVGDKVDEMAFGAEMNSILWFFKKNGYNVTREAIKHNLAAWLCDMKSGYRDEVNGYHLFSPCGCNPLSFRLTTLHELCDDWQETYAG